MKIKLIKEKNSSNSFDHMNVCIETEAETLAEVLEALDVFIKACGFNPKGTLGYVEEEE